MVETRNQSLLEVNRQLEEFHKQTDETCKRSDTKHEALKDEIAHSRSELADLKDILLTLTQSNTTPDPGAHHLVLSSHRKLNPLTRVSNGWPLLALAYETFLIFAWSSTSTV